MKSTSTETNYDKGGKYLSETKYDYTPGDCDRRQLTSYAVPDENGILSQEYVKDPKDRPEVSSVTTTTYADNTEKKETSYKEPLEDETPARGEYLKSKTNITNADGYYTKCIEEYQNGLKKTVSYGADNTPSLTTIEQNGFTLTYDGVPDKDSILTISHSNRTEKLLPPSLVLLESNGNGSFNVKKYNTPTYNPEKNIIETTEEKITFDDFLKLSGSSGKRTELENYGLTADTFQGVKVLSRGGYEITTTDCTITFTIDKYGKITKSEIAAENIR